LPNTPVRNLGGAGVISDINDYDLPPNAISAAVNVRFENGKITRAPVFRNVFDLSDTFNPGYVLSIPPISSGVESIIAVSRTYDTILSITGATVQDVTPLTTLSTGDTLEPFSHTFLGNVAYLNRKQNVPLSKAQSDNEFVVLPNWDPTWRTTTLRSYKDTLVALNVRKGSTEYPSMVKWSDFTQFGQAPGSWDETSTTNSAGENILNEMRGPIIDGLSLRDSFFIYGETEVWTMNYVGGAFIYDFRKRFSDAGIINANCVVEIDGMHYVFDRTDIYVHDGATKRSIIHGKNKDFVFGSLIKDYKHLCFVSHDPKLNELHFCYVSDDRLVGFRGAFSGCNRSATYNYRRDTWTFYDLPNVCGSALAAIVTGQTYEGAGTILYPEIGGTYMGEADDSEQHTLFIGNKDTNLGLTKSRIYGLDLATGGRLSKPVEMEALKDAFVERVGIDLDETGAPLSSYKSLLAFYPQLGIDGPRDGVSFQFGATDVTGEQPVWSAKVSFDPAVDSKVDARVAGRYLGYRLYHTGLSDFSFSGFDARVVQRGLR
jgi:hypothetical protein